MSNDMNIAAPIPSPTAVIVTRRSGQAGPIKEKFENEGWSVEVCEGPGRKVCPLMTGESCELREGADVAIVFMSPKEGTASTPRLRCAADPSSPGVVVLEGRIDTPRFNDTTATVGALRGPEAAVSTACELLVNGWSF